jgi:LCP family protein required for cell wall assembly
LETATPSPTDSGRSPALAALLSFLWPGLGQLYARRFREAAAFAIPVLLVLAALIFDLSRGVVAFGASLVVDETVTATVVTIVLLVGLWRLISVVHAYLAAGRGRGRRILDRSVVIGLLAVIVTTHAAAGYGMWALNNSIEPAFTSSNNDLIDLSTPTPSLAAGETPGPTPTPTPYVTPPSIDHRVTILFNGVDTSSGRSEKLYDTIMVVSFDPTTNSVQLISIPRDSASFPLYFGGTVSVTTRINSLPTYVANGWVASPDSPYGTLVKEVGYLVGLPINYYAVLDFGGFRKMIDTVGGIDVNNTTWINDPTYDWLYGGHALGFSLSPGVHHLDGITALAYVRSRHGSSDWARAARQQEVIVDLLHKMTQPDELLTLPSVISVMGASITTNFPPYLVGAYAQIATSIPAKNITQVVLKPPYTITGINYINKAATTCLVIPLIAQLSVQLFGKDSTWYHKRAANSCPIIVPPSPTASGGASGSPTDGPTPAPTASPAQGPTPDATPTSYTSPGLPSPTSEQDPSQSS